MDGSSRLASVLSGIGQAVLSSGLKKALAYRAVEMAMRPESEPKDPEDSASKGDELAAFEDAMSAVRTLFGDISIADYRAAASKSNICYVALLCSAACIFFP